MTINEDLAAIERFVVDNDDLLKLESLIGRFNIFDALDIARVEIRHSNALAFLLDPAESHGQGDAMLKAVLMDMLKAAPLELRPLSPIQLDGVDLRGVEVRREWQHIDLLISCQDPAFVLAVENKVDSGEHSEQLTRYHDVVASHFKDTPALYVFLTPSGTEPSHPSWVPYSYADIHRVLSRLRATHGNAIGDDVLVFLDHYLSLVGSRLMNDPSIDELCRRIYKNHRRALQLIYDRVGTPSSGVLAAAEAAMLEDDRWHRYYTTSGFLDFVPAAWLPWLPGIGLDFKEDPRSWFVARFEALEKRLDFLIEIRRMEDPALRKRVIEVLLAEGAKAGFKRKQAKEIRDSYTRICGRERVLDWTSDEPPEASSVQAAVKAHLDKLFPRIDALGPGLRKVLQAG